MTGIVGNFSTVDDTGDPSWFIRFSDAQNKIPEQQRTRQALIAVLGPLAGRQILDVGCGAGDDTREVAELVGPDGHVIGIDISQATLAEARKRGGPVEFTFGDMHKLPYADESFDGVRAKLVRMHSPDIETADDELIRVLRPGGKLAAFDYDFDMLAIDHPDRTTTREIMRYWADHHQQPWCGRQTRRRFLKRGLKDVTVTPHPVLATYELFHAIMDGPLAEGVASGALDVSPEEWWSPLAEAAAEGQFFACAMGFILDATR